MVELGALAADGEVRCAVLTGAGTAFCSGMDRNEFGGDRAHRNRLIAASLGAFAAVGTFAKPLIAALNGPALAGGFALALLCDLRIAGPEATVGFPGAARLGIPPAYAAARAALPGRVGARAVPDRCGARRRRCGAPGRGGRCRRRRGHTGAGAGSRRRGPVRLREPVDKAADPRRARG